MNVIVGLLRPGRNWEKIIRLSHPWRLAGGEVGISVSTHGRYGIYTNKGMSHHALDGTSSPGLQIYGFLKPHESLISTTFLSS